MGIRRRRTALLLFLTAVCTLCYLYSKEGASYHTQAASSYSDALSKNSLGSLDPALFFKREHDLNPPSNDNSDDDIDLSHLFTLDTDENDDDNDEDVYDRDDYEDEDEQEDEVTSDYDTKGDNQPVDTEKGEISQESEDKFTNSEKDRMLENALKDNLEDEEKKSPATLLRNAIPDSDKQLYAAEQDVHQSRLVVVAYMRTGSSMTGRILQLSPDVFYWYEPLHSLERYYVTGGHPESSYRNRTLNEMFKNSAMAGGNVSAALSCDIRRVYRGTLLDHFMTYGKQGTGLFHPCFTRATDAAQWQHCVANMTAFCRRRYKVTAVKSIRLHMARALEAMRRDPKVKVVHLVRDPRGVLLSRHHIGFADFTRLDVEAALLCGKLKEDLALAPSPGDPLRPRYLLVRYEDIAAVPLEHTQQLYRFMGLQPSPPVLQAVRDMTLSAKRKRQCPTCPPVPLNSTEVSQAWRHTLTLQQVQTVSKACADVMRLLGYRVEFESEAQLRDLRVSAVGPVQLR